MIEHRIYSKRFRFALKRQPEATMSAETGFSRRQHLLPLFEQTISVFWRKRLHRTLAAVTAFTTRCQVKACKDTPPTEKRQPHRSHFEGTASKKVPNLVTRIISVTFSFAFSTKQATPETVLAKLAVQTSSNILLSHWSEREVHIG